MANDLISKQKLIDDLEAWRKRLDRRVSLFDDMVIHALPAVFDLVNEQETVEAEPKWISVKEKLPENELSVIAYSKEDGHAWYAFRRGGSWWRPGDRISIKVYGTVTHWMPLPELPKEDEV